jgi:hypothetical protein
MIAHDTFVERNHLGREPQASCEGAGEAPSAVRRDLPAQIEHVIAEYPGSFLAATAALGCLVGWWMKYK